MTKEIGDSEEISGMVDLGPVYMDCRRVVKMNIQFAPERS